MEHLCLGLAAILNLVEQLLIETGCWIWTLHFATPRYWDYMQNNRTLLEQCGGILAEDRLLIYDCSMASLIFAWADEWTTPLLSPTFFSAALLDSVNFEAVYFELFWMLHLKMGMVSRHLEVSSMGRVNDTFSVLQESTNLKINLFGVQENSLNCGDCLKFGF